MLDKLHSYFKLQFQLSHTAALINHVGNIIAIAQAEYTKDKDAKNAIIDGVCEMLKSYKDQTTALNIEQIPQG